MHARVLSGQVSQQRTEELLRALHESVLPCAAEHAGYRGAFGLLDHTTGSGMLVTLWDTAADLERTEEHGYLSGQLGTLSAFMDGPALRETYEVVIEHHADPMQRGPLLLPPPDVPVIASDA